MESTSKKGGFSSKANVIADSSAGILQVAFLIPGNSPAFQCFASYF